MHHHMDYEHIPAEKFQFIQLDTNIHDKKLETKSRGYFADAFLRFKKNKSSLVAAFSSCSSRWFPQSFPRIP